VAPAVHLVRVSPPQTMDAVDLTRHAAVEIMRIREVTPELAIWRVRPRGAAIPFTPGQYVAMGVPVGGRMIERPYSICSAPGEQELEFFLELVEAGALTPRLFQMRSGEEVYLRRSAKGRFFLDRATGHHLMVASVTGVAPFVSILRDLVQKEDSSQRILLLQSASTPVEFGYADELTALSRAHEWFEYVPTVSRPWLAPDWRGERGRAEDVVRKHADRAGFLPDAATVYCCGNPQMIRNVQGVMERAGFPLKSIKEENYWLA
jgi:ferredoxin--NADP+ reductase